MKEPLLSCLNLKECNPPCEVKDLSETLVMRLGAAILAGFPRIGIGEKFVHLDIDETKAHPILFHYYTPQET